jgi:hypothetical protein
MAGAKWGALAAGAVLLVILALGVARFTATHARTEHVLGAQHTLVSKPVRICANAALDEYDRRVAQGEDTPFTRTQFRLVAGRYCEHAEAKGYFDHEATDARRVALMAESVRELRTEGRLPESAGAG